MSRGHYGSLPASPASSSRTSHFIKVFRKNCALSYQARRWLFSRCSTEPAGCIPCSLTLSNIPMFSQVIVTIAWRTCKQHSRKKSSNPLQRKQRNWKNGSHNLYHLSLSCRCFNRQGKPEGRTMTRLTLNPNSALITLNERLAKI